ncbi:hypothetical protein OPQ81_001064 [Rhizoctonia solani]|nr:hypothetical protein OPQ81_001064 [Rhizoctonia solani]
MNPGTNGVKGPRKLVIVFGNGYIGSLNWMIHDQGDQNGCPQLVHRHLFDHRKLSLLDRLLIWLRLKQASTPRVDQAVAEAHEFLSNKYRPGDQVILAAFDWGKTQSSTAASILASHLYDGTLPQHANSAQSGNEGRVAGRRISIHGIAVLLWGSTKNATVVNDELKSRFPPGVEHIITHMVDSDNPAHHSCSTTLDLDGGMVSRETSHFTDADLWQVFMHVTKYIIHYRPEGLPQWDESNPVWTRVLSTPPSGAQEILPEAIVPVGMYRHELRKEGVEQDWANPLRLVWKATRC